MFLCGAGASCSYLTPLVASAGLPRHHLPLVLLEVGVIGVPSASLGGPESPMSAVALDIGGLNLGTAAAAALRGFLTDGPGTTRIHLAATGPLALAWLSARQHDNA